VTPEPALGDGEIEASFVLGRGAAFPEERPVDLLDVQAAVLNRLDRAGDLQEPAGGLRGVGERSVGGVLHHRGSAFPVLGEWHGVALPVMPVRHDVNRAGRAAFGAQQVRADARPRLILGQGVQPDIRLMLAVAVEALDRTGDVALGMPFRRTARRVMT
jgi:hypothetical protein